MRLRVDVLREIPEDSSFRQQWNALVLASERPQVFYTYEWALAVYHAYATTVRPLLLVGYEGERPWGIAALAEDRERGEVSFLCATTGDYCDFLSAPEDRASFVAAVLAELCQLGLHNITLTNLPADSSTFAAIRTFSRQVGYHTFARTAYECAQVSIAAIERRRGSDAPHFGGKERLRRFTKAVQGQGAVRLDHAYTPATTKPLLEEFVRAHVARFLATGRISNFVSPERRRFVTELTKLLSESGWLTLTRLMIGQRNVAWNYGFQFEDTWFWYQPTFENDLEKYSPGYYLLAKLIEEAAHTPAVKTVDLGLGAEDYKDRFANQTRRTLYVTLRRSTVQHLYEIVRYRAARAFKTVPILGAGIRAGVGKIKRVDEGIVQNGVAATFLKVARRFREFFWLEEEVYFLHASNSASLGSTPGRLEALTFMDLASAALQYCDDQETLRYLMRSAARLRSSGAECFGLIDGSGQYVHFAWVGSFEGFFLSELNARVDAPSEGCVMFFDCWTPTAVRGNGYYGQAITKLSQHFREQGKDPWVFSAARNISSLRGLQKAGFERRYSLTRRRLLMWQRIVGETPQLAPRTLEGVAAPSESRAS